MKKILLSLSCLLISMCACFPASAQEQPAGAKQETTGPGSTKLSTNQWNHALAVCAQLVATDQGFAQSEENIVKKFQVPYTLDDLKAQYGSRDKWMPFYQALKSHEGKPGTMEDLKALINKEYTKFPFGNRVEKAMNDYISKNPSDPAPNNAAAAPTTATDAAAPAAADAAAASKADKASAGADDEGEQVDEEEAAKSKESGSSSGWQIALNLLLLAGLVAAILMAIKARRAADDVKDELSREIDALKRQLDAARGGNNQNQQRDNNQQRKNKNRQQQQQPERQQPEQQKREEPAKQKAHIVAPVSQTRVAAQLRDEKKREERKPEQQKREERKPEERKPEERKPEERKPEQRKPEERKPEQPKPEQPKPEQPKPEERKPEQPKKPEQPTLNLDDNDQTLVLSRPQQPEKKVEEKKAEQPITFSEPRIIYLGRPDRNSDFSNTADKMQLGDTIFELVTMDGRSGSFSVISNRDVHYLALQLPSENIIRACESETDLEDTAAKTKIVTDRAGRAKFIDGKWHVITKAKVHYE